MKVLIACECSGVVREAFAALGHDAWSCDLDPTELPGQHIIGDVLEILDAGWDLMIAHPPCTFLANSGAKHLYNGMKKEGGINLERWYNMRAGAGFFKKLQQAPIRRKCIENPIMLGHARKLIERWHVQTVQPWWFGHGETKATCLHLENLPDLTATNVVEGREARIWRMAPGPTRQKDRSRTLPGLGAAMADQWGNLI